MNTGSTVTKTRVAILQSRLAPFRIEFFDRLASCDAIDLTVFCSEQSVATGSTDRKQPFFFTLRPVKTFSLLEGCVTLQVGLLCTLLRGKFDVVVAEARLGLVLNPLVLLLFRLSGKRFLWWTCGWERSEMEAISSFKRLARRIFFKSAHGGIAYSTVAGQYLTRLGMKRERVWIAHNSLDTDSLLAIERLIRQDANWESRLRTEYDAAGKQIVLFVGKLTKSKNVDLLLRAFEMVRQALSSSVLWIVGNGPEKSHLEALARDFPGQSVRFLGEITEARKINSIYMTADVFALPGTGGLALNQAMTFGKPIVVSRADGTEEDLITDGKNGLYFKPGDSQDLASKILLLLRDSNQRIQMGQRARDHILQKVNMTNMIRSFQDAILNRRESST